MRLILEIEENEDVQRCERVISLLKPYLPKIQYSEKLRKIQSFLEFAEWESIPVEKLSIPGCSILFSEDMQDGRRIQGRLQICNPF